MDATPSPEPLTLPRLATKLSKLAVAVRSINTTWGRNPEQSLMQIDEIAAELNQIANTISGGSR